ncbi:MAG: TIGR04283 family arsenosugar biosynthesis glycosyltransferase [Acidobacteriota bacterium]
MHPAPVSVIIPTLNEARLLPLCLERLSGQDGLAEILVVDGGSRDETVRAVQDLAPRFRDSGVAVRLLRSRAGRAVQMNAGAAQARGGILMFLHADTLLPPAAILSAASAIDEGYVGGAFVHRFIERDPRLRLVSAYVNLRSRLARVYFGDQAIFIRRDLFERMNGFRAMSLMEDLEFARRMRRAGATSLRPERIRTSARRFLSGGVARTCARMTWLRLAYRAGADPERLSRRYRGVR